MEIQSYEHGVPCWVDVSSPDPKKAGAFYSGLFGWQVNEGPPEAGGYAIATMNDKPVAGVGPQMNPQAPPFWMTYVSVTSTDEVTAKVKAAGGQIYVEPMDVMDAGRMAIFGDPTGAAIGVWQSNQFPGAALVNEPGAYSWSELMTDDVEGAIAFYEQIFGWGHETHGGMGPTGYTEWKAAGRSIGGLMARPPQMPKEVPAHWAVYFMVADADEAVAKATGLGAQVLLPPMDIEPGRFAVLSDPTGAAFQVIKINEGVM